MSNSVGVDVGSIEGVVFALVVIILGGEGDVVFVRDVEGSGLFAADVELPSLTISVCSHSDKILLKFTILSNHLCSFCNWGFGVLGAKAKKFQKQRNLNFYLNCKFQGCFEKESSKVIIL